MGPRDALAALVVVAIWGFNFIVVKLGTADMPPLLITTLRFALVALLVTPFTRLKREHVKGALILSVTFGTLHFGLLFTGIGMVDAATAAIIIQLGAPFATLGAVLFFKESMGWARWSGLVLAFGGVVLVGGEPHFGPIIALVLLVVSALGWASSTLVMKTVKGSHPLTITGWLTLFALPQTLVLSLLVEGNPIPHLAKASWAGWGAVIYTAIFASIVAHSLWYYLLNKHPVTRVAPFALLAPIIGIGAGILVLGEHATPIMIIGGAITLTGVALIEIWGRRTGPKTTGVESETI